jgi:hypothetical protein
MRNSTLCLHNVSTVMLEDFRHGEESHGVRVVITTHEEEVFTVTVFGNFTFDKNGQQPVKVLRTIPATHSESVNTARDRALLNASK